MVFYHQIKRQVLPLLGPFHIDKGRIPVGIFDEPSQHGALCDRQLTGGFAEIGPGGRFDAIGSLCKINDIQIHFQYLIL